MACVTVRVESNFLTAWRPQQLTVPKPTRGRAAKPKPPEEVEVVNEAPLQVEIADDKNGKTSPPSAMVKKDEGMTLAPTTTAEGDRVTQGQRHINLIWESVQGFISIAITVAVIYCQIQDIQSETLNNAFFFVVATYLQRSNHVRIGGVGEKANEVYRGR